MRHEESFTNTPEERKTRVEPWLRLPKAVDFVRPYPLIDYCNKSLVEAFFEDTHGRCVAMERCTPVSHYQNFSRLRPANATRVLSRERHLPFVVDSVSEYGPRGTQTLLDKYIA